MSTGGPDAPLLPVALPESGAAGSHDSQNDEEEMMKVFTDLEDELDGGPVGPEPKGRHPMAKESGSHGVEVKTVDKVALAEERYVALSERQLNLEARFRDLGRRVHLLRCQKLGVHIAEEISRVHHMCQKLAPPAPSRPLVNSLPPKINPFVPVQVHVPQGVVLPSEPSADVPLPSLAKVKEEGETPGGEDCDVEANVGFKDKTKTDEVLGQMDCHLRHFIQNYDSEATESSSGGESCDEFDNYSKNHAHYLPIKKRAKWHWLSKRASIASKWTWLTAQISDLEYRIRQQTEFYRQIRTVKGPVSLGDPVVSWPPHAKKAVTSSPKPENEVPLNCKPVTKDYSRVDSLGRKIIIKEPFSPETPAPASDDDNSLGASRTRPLRNIRKRRILSTYNLPKIPHRASKESTVQCDCIHPLFWCALCYGRVHHTQVPDPLTQEESQSLALLDHSYHQVLSNPEDVTLAVLMAKKMKDKSWLKPPSQLGDPPDGLSLMKKKKTKRKKSGDGTTENGDLDSKKKKKSKKLNKNILKVKTKRRKSLSVHHHTDDRGLTINDLNSDSDMGMDTSPVPSPLASTPSHSSSNHHWAEMIRRKRETAFDIDNIVIPYSIAASTRVERLKYKEILTPTWRTLDGELIEGMPSQPEPHEELLIPKKPSPVKVVPSPSVDKSPPPLSGGDEDVSETSFEVRHARAEVEERKRWHTSVLKSTGGQRSRTRRQDSVRTEGGTASSGYNTPDHPMSPGTPLDATLEVSTRPSSPISTEEGGQSMMHSISTPTTPQINVAASIRNRRRTSSVTKSRDRNPSEDTQSSRCTTPTMESTVPSQYPERPEVPPFEPRMFPIPDQDYELMVEEMPQIGDTSIMSVEDSAETPNKSSERKSVLITPAGITPDLSKELPRPTTLLPPSSQSPDEDDDEEDEEVPLEEDDPDWKEGDEEEDGDDPEWNSKSRPHSGESTPTTQDSEEGSSSNPSCPSKSNQKNKHGLSLKINKR